MISCCTQYFTAKHSPRYTQVARSIERGFPVRGERSEVTFGIGTVRQRMLGFCGDAAFIFLTSLLYHGSQLLAVLTVQYSKNIRKTGIGGLPRGGINATRRGIRQGA